MLATLRSKLAQLPLKTRIIFGIATLVSFVLTGLLLFIPFGGRSNAISPLPQEAVLSDVDLPDAPMPSDANIPTLGAILVGYGGAGHDGGYLTDAIQVFYVDFQKARATLISIPRDLWVKLPNGTESKINAAIISGADKNDKQNLIKSGAPTLKKVLSDVTGLKIDYFVGVDFSGFQRGIGETLDGIEVEVAEPLVDPWYPIKGRELDLCGMSPEEITEVHQKYSGFELERQFECRFEQLKFPKGTVRMEGGDAMKYVRSRHGSQEGDISRGKRQQEVLTAARKKLFSLSIVDDLPGFFDEITKNTETDVTIDIIKYIVPALKRSKDFTFGTINLATTNVLTTGRAANGAAIILPKEGNFKWDGIQNYIQQELDK